MSAAALENSVKDLISHIQHGKFMEAFEKYYDDNVVMQENEQEPTIGKISNRLREQEFFSNTTGFENSKVESIATGNDVAILVWHYNYNHREWGQKNYKQVSVQHWKDGKIVKEQFFYGQ
jgi:hypothetical protein